MHEIFKYQAFLWDFTPASSILAYMSNQLLLYGENRANLYKRTSGTQPVLYAKSHFHPIENPLET